MGNSYSRVDTFFLGELEWAWEKRSGVGSVGIPICGGYLGITL